MHKPRRKKGRERTDRKLYPFCRVETVLAGWAIGLELPKSVRELPHWNYVTTSLEVGASPAAEPFAFELHDTQLQLGPRFQQGDL
jgi:hypothetical protein